MISNEKEFWTVGYSQWGRWQVRKASVDHPDKYTLVEDLGPELKAAYLEADGDFIYKAGEEHLSLITSGVPWLFVITTSGKLYVKRVAAPLNTAVLLDTGVLQASTCRGWKSNQYDVDSGLLVAYRKSGQVQYQIYTQVEGEFVWSGALDLYRGNVEEVSVRRLNDFRIGFYLKGPNRLLISDRFYIGGTSKTEFFSAQFDEQFHVVAATPLNLDIPFSIEEVFLANENHEFWVRGNYPFYSCDETWTGDVAISTNVSAGQGIERWWLDDGLLKIRMLLPLVSQYAYMSFRIRELNRIRFIRSEASRPLVPQLDIIYQAPPVPYDEHIASEMNISSVTISLVEKKNLQQSYRDELTGCMTVDNLLIDTTPVAYISLETKAEIIESSMQVFGVVLSTTQSGVTPI